MIYILRVTITYVNTKGENTLVTSNRNVSIQMKQIILTRVSHILWRWSIMYVLWQYELKYYFVYVLYVK